MIIWMAVYGGHWLQARSHFETDTIVGDAPVPHLSMMMMVMMMKMVKGRKDDDDDDDDEEDV